MDKPFFSIVIPVHNAEATLEAAEASIVGQGMESIEILAVDDASTDGSRGLLLDLAAKEPRLRPLLLDENVGAGEARNRGMEEAAGEYLLFLDADDTFFPGLFLRLFQALQDFPAQVACWGLEESYGSGRRQEVRCPAGAFASPAAVRGQVMELERRGLYGYLWNKAYHLPYLRERGLRIPTQDFNEDEMFNIDLFMEISSLLLLDVIGNRYHRQCGASLTNRYLPRYYPLAMKRVAALLSQQRLWGQDGEAVRRQLADQYLRYLLSALARNCDPRGGMTLRRRLRFAARERGSRLCRELMPYARPSSLPLRVLAFCLAHFLPGCLGLGRVVYVLRFWKRS